MSRMNVSKNLCYKDKNMQKEFLEVRVMSHGA